MLDYRKRLLFGVLIAVIMFWGIGCDMNIDNHSENVKETASAVFKNLNEESFSADNIMSTISELTSEKYKGRLAGTNENRLAAEYIAQYFKNIGLDNPEGLENYMQYYTQKVLQNNSSPELRIVDSDGNVNKKFSFLDNFRVHTVAPGISVKGEVIAPLLIIEDSSQLTIDNLELSGKILLIPEKIKKEMGDRQLITVAISNQIDVKGMIWEENIDDPNHRLNHFVVSPYVHEAYQHDNEDGPVIFRCDSSTYQKLCSASQDNLRVIMKSDYSIIEAKGANVIGLIPGTDDNLKDEFIIIGAHFDHVGDNKNGTYNPGALDNGSGTAVLMEIARILKDNDIEPKRPILFIAFNGEEEGLYGSKYFSYHPIYNLNKDKTVVINMDMVGSKALIPLTIGTDSKQDSELKDDLYRIAKELNIDAKKSTISNSDHSPFARRGIDAVCLIHEDWKNGYHAPGDTIKTVDKDRIKEVLKLVLYYIDKKAYQIVSFKENN